MEETSNVPKLRFKEFTEPWEEILLKDNAYIKGRIGWKNLKQSEYTIKGPYLIASKHINNGKIYWEKCDHLSNKRYLESPEIALKLGDVIFSKDGSLGNPALIKYLPHESTINGTMMLVRVNSNISPNFFYQVLNSDYFFRLLHVLKSGSSIPHIFQRDMNNFKFKIPIKIKEQEMIADFLELIDNKINLLSSTIEYLKDFKNYCLQNLFSENKLRFNYLNSGGFKNKNDFKSVKLESLIKKGKAGGTPKSSIGRYYKGNIPFLSISDMTMQGKYITFTSKKITKEAINDSSAWIIPKNSLLYSIYASIGFVSINKIDLSTSQAIFGIILKDNVNIDYIYYYLTYFKRFVHKFIETGTQGNLNKNILYNFIIKIPNSIEEQEKIASFLSLIDKKIDLTQNQITEMEKFKKGLLQQMFV
jgi:type I restriction enzyme S subunit